MFGSHAYFSLIMAILYKKYCNGKAALSMILYQLAKMMEQRERLSESIARSTGDTSDLMSQKEQIEEMMLLQASRWNHTETEIIPVMSEDAQENTW
jgi:hypothetical protein